MNDNVPLRAYVDARIDDLKEAIADARTTMDKRLDGMNEFRDSLRDQADRFATIERVDALEKLVQELRMVGSGTVGRTVGLAQWYGWIVAAIAAATAIVSLIRTR